MNFSSNILAGSFGVLKISFEDILWPKDKGIYIYNTFLNASNIAERDNID